MTVVDLVVPATAARDSTLLIRACDRLPPAGALLPAGALHTRGVDR